MHAVLQPAHGAAQRSARRLGQLVDELLVRNDLVRVHEHLAEHIVELSDEADGEDVEEDGHGSKGLGALVSDKDDDRGRGNQ